MALVSGMPSVPKPGARVLILLNGSAGSNQFQPVQVVQLDENPAADQIIHNLEQSCAEASQPSISCETFEEARLRVAENIGDEVTSAYQRDNAKTIDALVHQVFQQHPPDPNEWLLRVSKDGVVECVIFSRSTAFSTAIQAALRGAKLTTPHRAPLYLRYFANTLSINPGTDSPESPDQRRRLR